MDPMLFVSCFSTNSIYGNHDRPYYGPKDTPEEIKARREQARLNEIKNCKDRIKQLEEEEEGVKKEAALWNVKTVLVRKVKEYEDVDSSTMRVVRMKLVLDDKGEMYRVREDQYTKGDWDSIRAGQVVDIREVKTDQLAKIETKEEEKTPIDQPAKKKPGRIY